MTKTELEDIIFDIHATVLNLRLKSNPTPVDVENVHQLLKIVDQLDEMVADGRITLKDA